MNKKTLVITDIHLEPNRQGGTTRDSREALDNWLFERLEDVLNIPHDRLIINGDTLANFTVSDRTKLRVIETLRGEEDVILVVANHDRLSMKVNKICSLEMIAALLPNVTLVMDEPKTVGNMHFIPHVFEQKEFNKYLAEVPKDTFVFLHCNNNNGFATEADHSLNLSLEARDEITAKGCHIILGHEHAAADFEGMTVLGCLAPTSVADCLGGSKRAMLIKGDQYSFIETWTAEDNYIEQDWRDATVTEHQFVRIIGSCAVSEFPEVVKKVADMRKKAPAFILANAVKVETVLHEIEEQEVDQFNIMKLLVSQIDDEFKEEVESCL